MRKVILLIIGLTLMVGLYCQNTTHFVPAWHDPYQNPYLAMNIFIYGAEVNGVPLAIGDEIAVFDGETLVGASALTEPLSGYPTTLEVKASMDGGNVPGSAVAGNFILFKVWIAATDTEYSYPAMAVQFVAQPTFATNYPTEFVTQGTTYIWMIDFETPTGIDTATLTPPAGPGGGYVYDVSFPNSGVTLDEGYIIAGGGGDMTVYAYDENSVDTYYNETDPSDGTVPVENYSSYGWYIDSDDIVFSADISYHIVISFDLSAYGPNISDPSDLKIYRRDIHGTSYFYEVPTTYDPVTQTATISLTSADMLPGEFIVGSLNPEDMLPVELSSFTATMSNTNSAVNLIWVSQTETGMVGYRIYRGDTDELAEALDLNVLIEATNTSQTTTYLYSDTAIEPEHTYHYWLEALDMDGTSEVFGPIFIETPSQSAGIPEIPLVTGLTALYPNPFNPDLTVNFSVDSKLPVEIHIFNARGQKIKTLVNETKEIGNYSHVWNGRDELGRQCGSGVYHIIMKAGTEQFNRKAILLK